MLSEVEGGLQNKQQNVFLKTTTLSTSNLTPLFYVTDALKEARVAVKSSILILLNTLTAFDTVNHLVLLSIVLDTGVTGSAHSWFASYHLFTRAPQGSVLWPLLFAIYIPHVTPLFTELHWLLVAACFKFKSSFQVLNGSA